MGEYLDPLLDRFDERYFLDDVTAAWRERAAKFAADVLAPLARDADRDYYMNAAEAAQIKRALSGYGGIAQMTFQNRFFPATMRAVQLAREGFLGDVHEFRASYLHSGNATPETPLKWKLSLKHGGGVIADLGAHRCRGN